ncbi:MAG: hypothetical protein GQE15_12745 [Archangiaceae bacterium]|nr:hypothetical protein [Archangiaceae bacterium]
MNRKLFALCVVASSSVFAESAWEKKLAEARAQAAAQRQKLGLKNDTKLPTPELDFSQPPPEATGGTFVLGPGSKRDVALKGTNLPPGSVFIVASDDVGVSGEKSGANGSWSATFSAKPNALPRAFEVRAVQAGSGREVSLGRFLLGGKHTLVVDTGDTKLTVKLDFSGGRTSTEAPGEWSKGGKSLGSWQYTVSLGEGGLDLTRIATAEEGQAQLTASMASLDSPERKALNARLEKATKKMEPCGKLPPAKMGPCFAAVQPEMDAINVEMKKLNDQADLAGAPKVGCNSLSLNFTPAGVVDGDAQRCPGKKSDERVPVKGTFTTP